MQENEAERIVEGLHRHGVIARVARSASCRFGVRVPLGDGREALWDVDGAAGLEAQVMLDGILVGYVPEIPGSEEFRRGPDHRRHRRRQVSGLTGAEGLWSECGLDRSRG